QGPPGRRRLQHRRLPQDLRGAEGQGRAIPLRADRAALRYRSGLQGQLRQLVQHDAAPIISPPSPRGGEGRKKTGSANRSIVKTESGFAASSSRTKGVRL